jgi:hypothetical protein
MNHIPDWKNLKDYAAFGYDGQKPDISLQEYALSKLTPDLLVGITTLFFPEFVMHNEGIFLADRFSVTVYDGWNRGRYKNDVVAIERVMNHVHLVEGLGNGFYQLNKQNLYYIGTALVQTWKASLSYKFPDRTFEVQGLPDELGRSPDSGDFILTFWQPKKP